MVRRVGRAIAGLALILAATACDDNPLAEGRDQAAYFRLNPVNVAVEAGGTVKVDAILVNKFGAATNQAVTAEVCNSNISSVRDTARSEFEFPERFVITGLVFGQSCLVVSGGGLTDTVHVRIVPSSVDIVIADTDTLLASGSVLNLPVLYKTLSGTEVSGLTFDTLRTTFVSRNTAIGVIDALGNFQARAPGTVVVRASFTDQGVTRRDSVRITVVPGVFTGTAVQGSGGSGTGQHVTFTEGAVPFDADTQVRLVLPTDSQPTFFSLANPSATQRRRLIPFGIPAGTQVQYIVSNLGPNQLAAVGTFTTTATTVDAVEPDFELSVATPKSMVPGDRYFGTVDGTDADDLVMLTITEAGSYRVTLDWNDGSDIDMRVRNATNTGSVLSRLTLDHPETGLVTLAPGTYFVRVELYDWAPAFGDPSTYIITAVKQ